MTDHKHVSLVQDNDSSVPLCVDLDGTLVRTDLLAESLVALLRKNPLYIMLLPFWLLNGKAALKHEIAKRITLDPQILPYRGKFVEFLRKEAKRRHVHLVTAADRLLAAEVARHLGIFTEIFASDGQLNLAGKAKLHLLREKFGTKGFSYAGNAWVDMPVWQESVYPIVVGAPSDLVRYVNHAMPDARIWTDSKYGWREVLHLLRVHQWAKNMIVFVPLVTSHQLLNKSTVIDAFKAIMAFCFTASAIYIVNDLIDLESDRRHETKRHRPFASGVLGLSAALSILPILAMAAMALSWELPRNFSLVLTVYLVLTLAYSLVLKRLLIADTICLALLYTMRVIGGHEATGIVYSPWLLAFAMFLFFSLALVKRCAELQRASGVVAGRGYAGSDALQASVLGASSGLVAVLVLALYVTSSTVQQLYSRPLVLLLICPLLLYWISRIWMLTARGQMSEDPVLFALKDGASYLTGVLVVAVMLLGILL